MVCELREDKAVMFKVITSVCARVGVRAGSSLSAFIQIWVKAGECVSCITLQISALASALWHNENNFS